MNKIIYFFKKLIHLKNYKNFYFFIFRIFSFFKIKDLKSAIQISVFFHLLFLLFFLLNPSLTNKPALYVPSLKIDLVALPDLLKKDIQTPEQTQLHQEIKEVLKKADQHIEKQKKIEQSKEILKPNEMGIQTKKILSFFKKKPEEKINEKLDRKKIQKKNLQALNRIKALAKINDQETPLSLNKGNRISTGSSLLGETKETAEANYYDLIREKLQNHWKLPPWLSRQNLTAQIKIHINSQGQVSQFRFIKHSGNQKFDDAVTATLQESSPFPLPPSELVKSLLNDGISIGFPL